MKVGELIKLLAQHDFDMEVEVMINKISQVEIIDAYQRGSWPYTQFVLHVDVDVDELTE